MGKVLSVTGDIKLPIRMIEQIYLWYIYSNHDQTIFHVDNVKSLKHDIYLSNNDKTELISNISSSLETLYANYFPNREIIVNVITEENGGRLYVKLDVEVKDDKTYRLSKIVEVDKEKISNGDIIIENYYKHTKGYI